MKKNAFTDLLFNYENMSRDKKLQRLQDLENMMARFQGRPARLITIKNNRFKKEIEQAKQMGRHSVSYYARNDNKFLHIIDLNCSAMDAIKDIIHEGWHAYVDDFLNRAITLRTFSKVDKEDFVSQQRYMPEIYKFLEKSNLMQFFDWCRAEERINYQENSFYLAYFMLDAIEGIDDAEKLIPFVMGSFDYAIYNDNRAGKLESETKTTYKQITNELKSKDHAETLEFRKLGKISDEIDSEFLNFAQAMYEYLQKINLRDGEETNVDEKSLQDTIVLYNNYVSNLLRNKLYSSKKES